MQVWMKFTGRTPLLMHDPQLSDPDNDFVKQIKELTDKRKKTEQDRREIERLEWFGGLVIDPTTGLPAVKTAAVRKCLIGAGTISKQGRAISRALSFSDMHIPLTYDGPKSLEALWSATQFRNRSSVKIGTARTMRMRPQFLPWQIEFTANLLGEVIDFSDFRRIAELAGDAEGLGDNRVNAYGRFDVEVKML